MTRGGKTGRLREREVEMESRDKERGIHGGMGDHLIIIIIT